MPINRVSRLGYGDHVEVAPHNSVADAYGRFRVSIAQTNLDSKFLYDKLPLLWNEVVIGGSAIHDPINACINMSVTSAGQSVVRQTKHYFNYKAGKSQLYFFTGVFSNSKRLIQRIGAFDSLNGLFFELNDGILYVCHRKNGIDIKIPQSQWNIEKLNGSGRYPISIDITKSQLLVIDYQWLGVGDVRYGFYINGEIRYCHTLSTANIDTSVYISNPNLPVRYEITSTGDAGTLQQICSTCMSGGTIDQWITRSESTSNVIIAHNTNSIYALLGIRLKPTRLSATVIPTSINLLCDGVEPYKYIVSVNPTTNSPLIYNDVIDSNAQVAVASNETITNIGTKIVEGLCSNQSRDIQLNLSNILAIGSSITNMSDTIVLSVVPLKNNAKMYAALSWKELI